MTSVIESTDIKENYLADFESAIALYEDKDSYFAGIRRNAIKRFLELGFPTTRDEEWKYTRIKPIVNKGFKPIASKKLTKNDIQPFLVAGKEVILFVFENGRLNEDLSDLANLPSGIEVSSLESSFDHPVVKEHYSKYALYENEPLVSLNTAFAKDGAFISVKDNVSIEKPIHILYISTALEENTVSYPRALFVAGKSSHIQIIESHHSLNKFNSFTNAVTEIVASENADVDLYKVELEGKNSALITYTQVDQEKNSNCSVHTITLNGDFVRNNLNYLLNGSNCETHMYGLYVASEKQHVDNHTFVDHAMPHCYSNEVYKGVMADQSTGVFNGKIMVRPDAQKTNAYQSSSNILLSDDAHIYSKPQLEIFADDVKCSHGATTGQLDQEALFYLRSRGISEENARTMLIFAFASDVLNTIKIPALRESLQAILASKLNQEN
jgi:Fe-S cluster assembly protein SufD